MESPDFSPPAIVLAGDLASELWSRADRSARGHARVAAPDAALAPVSPSPCSTSPSVAS